MWDQLLGGALQSGMGIAGKAAKGNTKGLGKDIGGAAGGLLGTAFGGPVGSMLGGAAGSLLGGGADMLASGLMGGGKKKQRRRPGKKRKSSGAAGSRPSAAAAETANLLAGTAGIKKVIRKSSSPAAVYQQAAAMAARGDARTPKQAAQKMGNAAAALHLSKLARRQASDAIGDKLAGAGAFDVLARMAGLKPGAAQRKGVTPGMLVRQLGLSRLAASSGVLPSGAPVTALARALGLPPKVLRATGLVHGARERARRPVNMARAVRTVVVQAPKRMVTDRLRMQVELEGVEDDPRRIPPFLPPRVPPLNSKEGPVPRTPAPGGTPGAVPLRPENWDYDARTYVLGWGDTFTGLAKTYLGNGGRWLELWQAQDDSVRMSRKPDSFKVGEKIRMTAEASENARKLAGAPPGSQVTPQGKVVDPKGQPVGLSTAAKVGLGVAGAAAVGGILYAVTR